jgi:hypothetical protein
MNSIYFEESNLNVQGVSLGFILTCFGIVFAFFLFHFNVLVSQTGYGQSKWEAKKRNEKNARDRKDRALRDKESREKESRQKARIRRANQGVLNSQASASDFISLSEDVREWLLDNFGRAWLALRELTSELRLDIPDLTTMIPDLSFVEKYYTLIKGSDIASEAHYLVRMMISLGWIKKIDFRIKGYSFVATEPIREKVTTLHFFEKLSSFGKLVIEKVTLVFNSGNFTDFFASELKNEYDIEFAFLKSQKTCIDLGRKAEVSEETYDRRLAECIDTTNSYLANCKQSERAYYASRLNVLKDLQTSRTLSKKDNIREKPYGVLLFGDSGVGKSAISNALTRYILQVNGRDYSPRAIITLNQEDKFQSEFSTYHDGVIMDDIGNTALDFTDGSPATPIIMFLNQVPMAALNPNAEMKGKVMIEPSVVCGTTNVKDLLANQLSNEPLSIVRRFECTITQKVRPEYRKKGTDMLDNNKIRHMANDQFPDYALFTVEEPRYVPISNGNRTKSGRTREIYYVPREFEGKPLVDVDIVTLLRFLKEDSQNHFAKQKAFVEGQRSLADMPLCEHQLPPTLCPDCKLESHSGMPRFSFRGIINESMDVKQEVIDYLLFAEARFMAWFNSLIRTVLTTRLGNFYVLFALRWQLIDYVVSTSKAFGIIVGIVLLCDLLFLSNGAWIMFFVFASYVAVLCGRAYTMRSEYVEAYNFRSPSQVYRDLSDETKMKLHAIVVFTGVWAVLKKTAQTWVQTLPTAQAAAPISFVPNAKPYQLETEHWDTRQKENAYKFGDAGITEAARTISTENLDKLVGKSLKVLERQSDGVFCNAVPLTGSMFLIPNHMVTTKVQYVNLTNVGGHVIKNLPLSVNNCTRVEGQDFAVWYCPGAGPQRDLLKYYPKDIEVGKKITVHTVFNNDGEIKIYGEMTAERGRVITSQGGVFQGLRYSFPDRTYGGLCMATFIGRAKGMPFIAGHHLAGRGTVGGGGFVTRETLERTIARMCEKPGVLQSHSAQPFETKILGVDVGPLTAPHEKCPTRGLTLDAKLRIHGGHNQPRSSPTSAVVTSLISSAVTDVMGIGKQHGSPKDMGAQRHKEVDIAGKTDTATKFDPLLSQKAFTDYSLTLASLPSEELVQVGKVSDDANLAGLDGVLGVNAMNFSTSMGFPFKGPKTQYVEKSDRQVEGISCPRDVDPMILEEVARLEQLLLEGKSINTVFKASLKDEPTKLNKDKVRVFAAANMPFVFLVRKYYLSLAALFQRNKTITECAVGTVVQSPEWTELYEHIGKFGWDRAIAGDYAKFDGRMSPEFMFMAFKILITLAEKSGNYDADDLIIMRGIASEITYPTYDYFGTLVQFFGSNPSGHPLTVIINSIVNSLYMRYTYYALAAKQSRWTRIPPFAKGCSLMTYGDDNIMTVLKGLDWFNHTAIAAELNEVGITYTMADKDAESVPFINLSDASFLKHFAVKDEELGIYRSPVEESSIAKMLHTHLKSKVLTMEQSSAEAIQNVALKYFEFGRDVYNQRREELIEVARRANIAGYVGPIMTYDERVEWYKEKFFPLESQSGYRHEHHECKVNSEEEHFQGISFPFEL